MAEIKTEFKVFATLSDFVHNNNPTIIDVKRVPDLKKAFITGKWGTGKTTVLNTIKNFFGDAYRTVHINDFQLTPLSYKGFLDNISSLSGVGLVLIDNLNVKEASKELLNDFLETVHRLFQHFVFISIDANNLSDIKRTEQFGRLNQFQWVQIELENKISEEVKKAFSSFNGSYHLAGSVWEDEDQTERFLKEGIWQHGFNEPMQSVRDVMPGDIVFLKSSFAYNSTAMLRIKAVGQVIANIDDGFTLRVSWKLREQVDIPNLGSYRSTFMRPSEDDLQIILVTIGQIEIFNAGLFSGIIIEKENTQPDFDLSTNLKNSGDKLRNDVIDKDGPIDITAKSIICTIFPKTYYWRFGFRFSKSPEIDYDLNNQERHANKSFRDLHISVGLRQEVEWIRPEALELNQYHFPGRDHVLKRYDKYKKLEPIIFRVMNSPESKVIEVSVKSAGLEEYLTELPLEEFRFFSISAWADSIDFDLSFVGEIMDLKDGEVKIIEGKYTPHDNWQITEDDVGVIGVQDLAGIMGNLLKNLKQTDKGKMVGIFGPWGRGKTFLVNHTWSLLEKETVKPFTRIDFHAWKYQDTPASWAYLYETFADEYFKSSKETAWDRYWEKIDKKLRLNLKRVGWGPIILFVLTVIGAGFAFWFGKEIEQITRFFLFFGIVSLGTVQMLRIIKKSVSEKAKELFDKYYTKVSFSNLLGTQAEIQNELRLLLQHWIKERKIDNPDSNTKEKNIGIIDSRILLFVDDIDRCKEDRIMEIIDALRVMLEDEEISKRVVVLAAVDERVLKRAIKCKYHDILSKDCDIDSTSGIMKDISESITREYMDKLFLSGMSLGSLSENERIKILGKYIRGRSAPRVLVSDNKSEDTGEEGSFSTAGRQNNPSASGGATTTTSTNNKTVDKDEVILKLDDKKYDLTKDEEEYLVYLMAFCNGFTPRQIRIFYYRYLLARNVLKIRYERANRHITKSRLENLARLILHFSLTKEPKALENIKIKTLENNGPYQSLQVFGSSEGFNTNDLIEYLEVIEIVVSY